MKQRKKDIEFELNLIPFIDMFSACLSFLLLSAVWAFIGTVDTKQAIGAESQSGKNPPSVIVQIDKDNSFEFELKDVNLAQRKFSVKSVDAKPNWKRIDQMLAYFKKIVPQLNTSLILARPGVTYGHTIQILDLMRKADIKDVGISPT